MLADQLDYIVGVDPHRDAHALAVVHVLSGAVVLEATVASNTTAPLTTSTTASACSSRCGSTPTMKSS